MEIGVSQMIKGIFSITLSMKKYRRTVGAILMLAICLSFCGCTDKSDGGNTNMSQQEVIEDSKSSETTESDTDKEIMVDDSGELPNTDVEFSDSYSN